MALKAVGGKSTKTTQTRDDVFRMAQEYDEVSNQIKMLDKTKKSLSESIKKLAEKFFPEDDKGSHIGDNGAYQCGKQAKHSISLNEGRAMEIIRKKHLTKQLVTQKTVDVIDEKALETCVATGKITQEEFDYMMDDVVSYAVVVKKLEEMPEVEQTTVHKAARKK